MLFGIHKKIDEVLITILRDGSLSGSEILRAVAKKGLRVTKQAIYLSLRNLVHEEVVNKAGGFFSLNRIWLKKLYAFGREHMEDLERHDIANVLDFEEGDRVTYEFKNPFLLDVYWGHLYDIIYEAHDKNIPLSNYHPHEWLILVRAETERYFLERFVEDKKLFLFSIGGDTALDKKFKKDWSSDFVKINTGISYQLKHNQYLSVLGDFVFEVSTTAGFSEDIHEFFTTHSVLHPVNLEKLRTLSHKKHRSKLTRIKSRKKSQAWFKKFSKDFHIPKGYYF